MFAAIDAGSNTLRLLVGDVCNGKIVPKLYRRCICRLAGGFSVQEGLSPEAMERTLSVFEEFADICSQTGVVMTRAVGTAAFRQALNGELFANEVRAATGIPLEIITGGEEAQYTASGVLIALEPIPANALIVDIGGGSTEFVLCNGREVVWAKSYPLGVVRLTESHQDMNSRQAEIKSVIEEVYADIKLACFTADLDPAALSPVGTAGTVTTLAALDMGMTDYDSSKVNNYIMTCKSLAGWHEALLPLTPSEREALPGMEKGRGDLIVAGLEILLDLLKIMSAERLIISDFGILEGLLLSLQRDEKLQPFH